MKILNARLIRVSCAVLMAAALSSLAWAQSSGIDVKPSFPQVMTVDQVDLTENIVVLDGERYRLPEAKADDAESTTPFTGSGSGNIRVIGQLQRGMRVQVVTDGSMPSSSHVPVILQLERAQ